MDFTSISPKTSEQYSDMLLSLAQSSSLDEASKRMPEKLYAFIKHIMESEKKSYEDAVKCVKKYLNDIKVIKVTLAFSPSSHLKKQIMQSLESFGAAYIVEISIDESMIAGVKLSIDGRFFDESITSKIHNKVTATAHL